MHCGNARHAVTDPLSMLYYPFRAERYWWSIVLLLRPTVIALLFNARNRETGVQHSHFPSHASDNRPLYFAYGSDQDMPLEFLFSYQSSGVECGV